MTSLVGSLVSPPKKIGGRLGLLSLFRARLFFRGRCCGKVNETAAEGSAAEAFPGNRCPPFCVSRKTDPPFLHFPRKVDSGPALLSAPARTPTSLRNGGQVHFARDTFKFSCHASFFQLVRASVNHTRRPESANLLPRPPPPMCVYPFALTLSVSKVN